MTRTCERFIEPGRSTARCGRRATHFVPNYFNRNARGKGGDRRYFLCRAHAADWNANMALWGAGQKALVLL